MSGLERPGVDMAVTMATTDSFVQVEEGAAEQEGVAGCRGVRAVRAAWASATSLVVLQKQGLYVARPL